MSSARAQAACQNAKRALIDLAAHVPLDEPFAPALMRAAALLGAAPDYRPLLDYWQSRALGNSQGSQRYRWELSHARVPSTPSYAGAPDTWRAWHPAEQSLVDREPYRFEERLSLPLVINESYELLAELAAAGGELADHAEQLRVECEPTVRRDFAMFIQIRQSWMDTFALWSMVRYPHALTTLHPFALALATCYAQLARESDGVALGTRFPFHLKPLVSVNAQLASGLLALGLELDLVCSLLAFCKAEARDGAWGDVDQPADVLTTLVTADLLASVDPSFDPLTAAHALCGFQEPQGWWRALGPEAPWLTAAVLSFLERAQRPFSERFRWPHVQRVNCDQKTGLPVYATFKQLAQLFSTFDGLAGTDMELGFIDLAGFRAFNNQFGQDCGDDVLACFANELTTLPHCKAIRDGGDEFLLVGAPTHHGLAADVDALRTRWPARFAERFGVEVPPVAPRVLIARTQGRHLQTTRQALGRAIGQLKHAVDVLPPAGIQRRLEGDTLATDAR